MEKAAIFHQPYGAYADPLSPYCLRVRLRVKKGDLTACTVYHGDRYSQEEDQDYVQLQKTASDMYFDYFTGDLPTQTKRIRYVFYVQNEREAYWYGENGFSQDRRSAGVFQYAYITYSNLFDLPEWALDGVVYQIFPERFANGDRSNDPQNVEPWTVGARPKPDSYYGGDLQGVMDRLPYLEKLGVNVLYFTPIFRSPSNHKYDTTDYYQIDPHFGDMKTFRKLVEKAHRHGMRVILDAVMNHTGVGFFAFRDVIDHGSVSRYADWFHISSFPVQTEPRPNYETFANDVWTMPKLRTQHPEVKAYFLDVAEYWVKEVGIDGWRLDVANEVEADFWRAFRQRVKKANPEALIVGEVWHDASPWLMGDQFDSVMNYLFRDAVVDFFGRGRIGAEELDARLAHSRMLYRTQPQYAMFNLLDSHDTERFLTTCGGNEKRMRLAVLFQTTYVGMPMIYYGDEVGMQGGSDPDCRRPMIWEKRRQNRALFNFYRKVLRIRREQTALRRGNIRVWVAQGRIYGFLRRLENDCVGVIVNNSDHMCEISLDTAAFGQPTVLVELLSGQSVQTTKEGRLFITLAPYEGRVYTAPSTNGAKKPALNRSNIPL